jgi:H+/Cl- antiporter ClcA
MAFLLIGAGFGLFLANVFTRVVLSGSEAENTAIYFGMIAFFGGLGMLIAYGIEKKEYEKKNLEK